MGYAVSQYLCNLIATTADLSKTYHGPLFEPHVTLLGDLLGSEDEITAQTLRLAPYDIQLTFSGYEDYYFRCLFLRVRETQPVMEANAQARAIFNREADPPICRT